jgi:hypothetical protein
LWQTSTFSPAVFGFCFVCAEDWTWLDCVWLTCVELEFDWLTVAWLELECFVVECPFALP